MKICDRHGIKNPKQSRYMLIEEIEGIEYNLCDDCYLEFMDWVRTPPKQRRKKMLDAAKELVS